MRLHSSRQPSASREGSDRRVTLWRQRHFKRLARRASISWGRGQQSLRRGLASWLPVIRRGEHAFVVITAVLLGIAGAYGAIAFREVIRLGHIVFFATDEYSLSLLDAIPWWRRLLQPTVGGLAVGVIVTFAAPEVRGSGIPEVMEAVARRGGAIRFRVVVTKTLAAALTIASGGSAGREGPVVHIGAAISSFVGQLLQVSARRLRTFVACGTAAAIAATFNAPIAGALFAVEVVLGDLGVAHLSPIVISSVVATVISRHYLGDFPAFEVPAYQLLDSKELLLYALLGVLAAGAGVAFTRVLFGVGDLFERTGIPRWLQPAIGGLGVGVITLWFPHVYGVGYETINGALWGRLAGWVLALLVVAKLLATALTLGSGGSGGVFAPSLFLGAVLGAAFGNIMHGLFPDWTAAPGAYALVGMGALVAATTHAPITAILIIFELTNDYRIIPPLMLSCVIGVLLSTLVYRDSIYTAKLARKGVRLSEGRDINLLRGIAVSEVMHPDAPSVAANVPFSKLVPRLLGAHNMELMVVDDDQRLLGTIALSDLRAALPESEPLAALVVAADVMDQDAVAVQPTDRLDVIMHLFAQTHREELPVVADLERRRLLGVVTRDDVIKAYNQRSFQLDQTGGFHSMAAAARDGRRIEILGGVYLTEVDIPHRLVGKTLREACLRQECGVEVVLIHRANDDQHSGRRFPEPDVQLEAGDRLLVMGTSKAIQRMQE